MKISVDHLERLFEKYEEKLQIKYFSDLVVRGNCYLASDIVLPEHMKHLKDQQIQEIDIFYDRKLYEYLSSEFPATFRKPFGRLSFLELDRHLEMLNTVNGQTRRKRYIQMVGEVYGMDSVEGKRIILIGHNEMIDFRKWNGVKRNIDRDYQFYYRNSEVSIIVFVDLSMPGGSGYVEKFKKSTDLISLLVSKIQDFDDIIAPDFLPTEDVISVTDPSLLLEEYIKSNARLIIIGEQLNDSYKRALINVRKYDKYVRMLVVPALDHRNLNHFFKQVTLVYNVDRWAE